MKRAFRVNNPLAVTYFPTPLQVQYRERYEVSLPCSGWERVGPSCSYHQEKNIKLCRLYLPGPLPDGRVKVGELQRGPKCECTPGPKTLALGSGGRIRTYDLWVMSPTSCHCSTPHRKSAEGDFEQLSLFVAYRFRVLREQVNVP